MAERKPHHVGVICPECGASLNSVSDTRNGDGFIRRRRECPNGHRTTTYEILASRLNGLFEVEEEAARLVEGMAALLERGSR